MEKEITYLEAIIKPLVTFPDDVAIVRTVDERGTLLSVTLHKEDMGKVIGKSGETARAIRKLVRNFGLVNQSHVSVKINEPI